MPQASHPTVLITGSNGFLGEAIARGLLDRYRVIGLDLKQPKGPISGVETIEVDLTSDESVANAMAEVRKRVGVRIASVMDSRTRQRRR
jgi:nucleoside-diphosphate-sugar epimerase